MDHKFVCDWLNTSIVHIVHSSCSFDEAAIIGIAHLRHIQPPLPFEAEVVSIESNRHRIGTLV